MNRPVYMTQIGALDGSHGHQFLTQKHQNRTISSPSLAFAWRLQGGVNWPLLRLSTVLLDKSTNHGRTFECAFQCKFHFHPFHFNFYPFTLTDTKAPNWNWSTWKCIFLRAYVTQIKFWSGEEPWPKASFWFMDILYIQNSLSCVSFQIFPRFLPPRKNEIWSCFVNSKRWYQMGAEKPRELLNALVLVNFISVHFEFTSSHSLTDSNAPKWKLNTWKCTSRPVYMTQSGALDRSHVGTCSERCPLKRFIFGFSNLWACVFLEYFKHGKGKAMWITSYHVSMLEGNHTRRTIPRMDRLGSIDGISANLGLTN